MKKYLLDKFIQVNFFSQYTYFTYQILTDLYNAWKKSLMWIIIYIEATLAIKKKSHWAFLKLFYNNVRYNTSNESLSLVCYFELAYNLNAKVDPRADISVLASLLPEGVRVILDVS